MAELNELATQHQRLLVAEDLHVAKGRLHVNLRISTVGMERTGTGLPISNQHEDVQLWFDDTCPNRPPLVVVAHGRFVGFPHVLVGFILCIYLDLDREWHPALGMKGVVARLVDWFGDAAADRFDSRAALYHPIGGLPPSPLAPGTVVVRKSVPPADRKPLSRATIQHRTVARSDLVAWTYAGEESALSAAPALVLRTTEPIPLGLVNVSTLGDLALRVEHASGPDVTATAAALHRLLSHLSPGDPLRLVVEVAHPRGGPLSYLTVAQVAPFAVERMRSTAPSRGILDRLPIGWLRVSDERAEIITRRDSRRPMASFEGRTVELWGCGGLGSWMAEFICRAGAARVVLRDTGVVDGGLLVRQNYVEDDIGMPKSVQLADRLRSIRDEVTVEVLPGSALDVLADGYERSTDILIDATVNVTVAARLDEWARAAKTRPLMAQVATDPRSATLGMLSVASPDLEHGPATVDDATWESIKTNASLEPFHGFWTEAQKSEQLVPALGCSTPTFHGSAADLACLAGSLVSLLAAHVDLSADGTHLIESSHARGPGAGAHHFIPFKRP